MTLTDQLNSHLEKSLALVTANAPILRAEAEPVTPDLFPSVQRIAIQMFACMYQRQGVGLAAPQIGLPLAFFCLNPEPKNRKGERFVINPEILHYSYRHTQRAEGCLSVPGVHCLVDRPSRIICRYTDIDGKSRKFAFEGITGRIFQHEYDHLHGIFFFDRASAGEKEAISPALVKFGISANADPGYPYPQP